MHAYIRTCMPVEQIHLAQDAIEAAHGYPVRSCLPISWLLSSSWKVLYQLYQTPCYVAWQLAELLLCLILLLIGNNISSGLAIGTGQAANYPTVYQSSPAACSVAAVPRVATIW
eukprot:GHRR01019100.1.p2 GENE.GHRR01019100.1~~GHRR01019100.1.p2  ORF type:complete len:114 (+),score=33.27 GHRR01019100.1:156-497(+)